MIVKYQTYNVYIYYKSLNTIVCFVINVIRQHIINLIIKKDFLKKVLF